MNTGVKLTAEESRVVEYAAWGATQKDIARLLGKSISTVTNQLRSAFSKTGVTKINELSAWWFCTHFNISFDLSPLKRTTGATILIVLLGVQMLWGNEDMVRSSTVRRGNCTPTICMLSGKP